MANAYPYIISNNKIGPILGKIRSAAKPERLSQKLLKTWGFAASNDRAIIGVLKDLGFLTEAGAPTEYYDRLRDTTDWPYVLGERIKDLYADLYAIDTNIHTLPDNEVKGAISRVTGKDTKSVARYHSTFKSLATLAKFDGKGLRPAKSAAVDGLDKAVAEPQGSTSHESKPRQPEHARATQYHYNIQIHLPSTTDISVYHAIFRSLRDNLNL
ncbi:MAG: DUF5343 domain-containing protein [Pirellulales bacterium]